MINGQNYKAAAYRDGPRRVVVPCITFGYNDTILPEWACLYDSPAHLPVGQMVWDGYQPHLGGVVVGLDDNTVDSYIFDFSFHHVLLFNHLAFVHKQGTVIPMGYEPWVGFSRRHDRAGCVPLFRLDVVLFHG